MKLQGLAAKGKAVKLDSIRISSPKENKSQRLRYGYDGAFAGFSIFPVKYLEGFRKQVFFSLALVLWQPDEYKISKVRIFSFCLWIHISRAFQNWNGHVFYPKDREIACRI